ARVGNKAQVGMESFDVNAATRPHVSLGYLQQSRCAVPFLTDDSLANDNGDDGVVVFRECVRVLAEKVGVLTRRLESRLRLLMMDGDDSLLFTGNKVRRITQLWNTEEAEFAIKREEDGEDANSLDNLSGQAGERNDVRRIETENGGAKRDTFVK
ncbi:hypothetical protein Tco_0851407, partial [Tanacetum coccineum]